MSIPFWRIAKSNRPRLRLGLFFLVRCFKSTARRSSRHARLGDFLAMMQEAMSITATAFVLIILPFGFDSTGPVASRRQGNRLRRICSRSHDAVIRVYDEAGNVIETHEHNGISKSASSDVKNTPNVQFYVFVLPL